MQNKIVTIENKRGEKLLRHKTEEFDFRKYGKKEITELISRMKKAMRAVHGVGLSANQIGLNFKVFVAEVPDAQGGIKSYTIFNPKIEKLSSEKIGLEEGCLSVPLSYGEVERPARVTLSGQDKNGKPLKIKAWGILARVFQHEVDHLEGKLFIDKARNLRKYENVRNYEKEQNL
jgi:peptide deformylase